LEALKSATKKINFDQGQGMQIVQDALKALTRTIAANAGVEGSVVIEKLLSQNNTNFGYNALTGIV
jgi:chaperonin GroEL